MAAGGSGSGSASASSMCFAIPLICCSSSKFITSTARSSAKHSCSLLDGRLSRSAFSTPPLSANHVQLYWVCEFLQADSTWHVIVPAAAMGMPAEAPQRRMVRGWSVKVGNWDLLPAPPLQRVSSPCAGMPLDDRVIWRIFSHAARLQLAVWRCITVFLPRTTCSRILAVDRLLYCVLTYVFSALLHRRCCIGSPTPLRVSMRSV